MISYVLTQLIKYYSILIVVPNLGSAASLFSTRSLKEQRRIFQYRKS